MIENIQAYGTGLNLDDDIRVAKSGDGRERRNIEYDTSENGGVVVRAQGNEFLISPIDTDEYTLIVGEVEDKETNSILYIMASGALGEQPYESILRKNSDETVDIILKEHRNLGIIGVEGWGVNKKVECAVTDGKLFWVDKNGIPKKINIERAKNYHYWKRVYGGTNTVYTYTGTETDVVPQNGYVHVAGIGIMRANAAWNMANGYVANLLTLVEADTYWNIEDDITQIMEIKQPPTTTVIVEAVTDLSITENKLSESSLQFAYRFIYKDYEQSVWSKPSAVVTNPFPPDNASSANYNAIDVLLTKGNNDVLKVELAVCNAVTQLWFKAGEIKASEFNGKISKLFRYTGVTMYGGVSLKEIDKPYDAVPIVTKTVAIQENRLFHGDITEGYSVDNPITMTVTPSYIGALSYAVVYNVGQTGWGWGQSLTPIRTFNTKIYSFQANATQVADLGYTLTVKYTWNGTAYIIGQVIADGIKTWEIFAQEVVDVLNTIYTQSFVSEDPTRTATDIWARTEVEIDGNVRIWVILGLRKEAFLANINLSVFGEFDGIVEEGEYVSGVVDFWDGLTILSNFYEYDNTVAFYNFSVSYGAKETTYKGNSTYEGGVTFYDKYLRKAPMVAKQAFTIPIRNGVNNSKQYYLKVRLNNRIPDWAEYYSFTQSDSSVLDSAEVTLNSGGSASTTSIEGIPAGDELIQFRLSGIKPSEVTAGFVYYKIVADGGNTKMEVYTDSGYTASKLLVTLNKTNEDVYIDGIPYSKWTNKWGQNSRIYGYAIAKMLTIDSGVSNKIGITFNETVTEGSQSYFRLDISPYVNSIKKGNSKNIFMPRKGDYVRVKQSIDQWQSYARDILLSITDITEGRVEGQGEDAYFASYIIETSRTTIPLIFTYGGILEMYRLKEGGNSLFYEEPTLRPVPIIGGIKQFVDTDINVYNGDTYLRNRRFTDSNGGLIVDALVEDFRVTDNQDSKVWNKGRVNIEDSTAIQKRIKSGLRHGGRLLEETKINDLCRFDSDWIMLLNDDNGAITKVIPRSNSIRVLQERRATTIDIGRSLITRPDGSEDLVAINKVFGSKREAQNSWGCVNPESVLVVGDTLYYYDRINGQYLSDGANGQFPISGRAYSPEGAIDFKMHTFFNNLSSVTDLHLVSGWNEKRGMLYVTDFTNQVTVGFHTGTRRWLSFYDFVPEMYSYSGVKCYSFKQGYMYRHDANTETFYGETYDSKFDFIANQASAQNKIYDALCIKGDFTTFSSLPNVFVEIDILPSGSYPRGMYSRILRGMFRIEEGDYKASVLKNMLTTNSTPNVLDLHNGEDMRGNAAVFTINTMKEPFKLFLFSVVETPSM